MRLRSPLDRRAGLGPLERLPVSTAPWGSWYADEVAAVSTLVRRLGTVGSDLPADLAAQIVALGRDATALLLRVLDEDAIAGKREESEPVQECAECGEQHDNCEWARFHAVDLLTELREPAAIEAMLHILERTGSDDPIHDKIVERLPHFGEAALEPTLAALARTPKETETTESLCCVLSVLGVRDDRILQALLNFLNVHPRAAAMYLAEYGDPAACPAMLAVITAFRAKKADSLEESEWMDVVDAYTSLGGELPDSVVPRSDAAAHSR